MNALFGNERAEALRVRLDTLPPHERELAIVEDISQALMDMGGKFVLPFCFKNDTGRRTSHHLVFVSKNFTGYGIMKGIMAGESSKSEQGVPSFEYNPADKRHQILFELTRPVDDLAERLAKAFAGQTLTMREVYERHSPGTPYIDKNYKDALRRLEADKRILTEPAKRRTLKGELTFADSVKVTFPK